jgi:hypothetical protein
MKNGKLFETAYAIFAGVIYTLVLTILVLVITTQSCSTRASWSILQQWTVRYEPAQQITSYRWYWSTDGSWYTSQSALTPADGVYCYDEGVDGVWDRCSDLGAVNALTDGAYIYVSVSAINAAGESVWDRAEPLDPLP